MVNWQSNYFPLRGITISSASQCQSPGTYLPSIQISLPTVFKVAFLRDDITCTRIIIFLLYLDPYIYTISAKTAVACRMDMYRLQRRKRLFTQAVEGIT